MRYPAKIDPQPRPEEEPMRKLGFLLTLLALFTFACAPAEEPAAEAPEPAAEPEAEPAAEEVMAPTAVAILHNAEGEVVGKATFTQGEGVVLLDATVEGVERDGPHGFHVHAVGECVAPDFKSAGGHFNPLETEHACPPEPARHAGDFGNIEIAEGAGHLEIESQLVSVTEGPISVIGKAVVLHAGTDDCVAQPTGDAGARLACGVIMPGDGMMSEGEEGMESEGGEEMAEGDGGEAAEH